MKKLITGIALVFMMAGSSVYAADSGMAHGDQAPQENLFWLQHDGNEGYTKGW